MDATLNFKTHLLNTFFGFLSRLNVCKSANMAQKIFIQNIFNVVTEKRRI
jgi:hypothetical protein